VVVAMTIVPSLVLKQQLVHTSYKAKAHLKVEGSILFGSRLEPVLA
jgi:hypothetical protein